MKYNKLLFNIIIFNIIIYWKYVVLLLEMSFYLVVNFRLCLQNSCL